MAGDDIRSLSDLLQELGVGCPFCGESFTVTVDFSAGEAEYVEDCRVCCQPMRLRVTLADGCPRIDAEREND